MEQLNGLDAGFLNMETPTVHGHVGSVALFQSGDTPLTPESLAATISERLHELPPYRRRLMTVPFGLDRPYWIEDDAFDLEFHIRHIAVPAPGDHRQLAELVGRLHSRPLDRTRPLWELYLIEGLESGHVAQYTKIHHACVDGVTGTEILTSVLDTTPQGRPPARQAVPWSPDRVPSGSEMFGRGLLALVSQPRAQMRMQRRITRATLRLGGRQVTPTVRTAQEAMARTPVLSRLVPPPVDRTDELLSRPALVAPRLSFNRSVSAHRRFAFVTLPLDDVKEIKDRHGVTVNDVVMAICAGGLRTWLAHRQELPTDPLLALVPVSIRTDGDTSSPGSQLSAMVAPLPSHEDDPLRRLALAHDAMAVAKSEHAAMPADLLQDFGRFAPPAVAARVARLVARTRLADYANPPFNLVISNIPGPQHSLYCAGSRQVAAYPVSLITDGAGLNITLASYDGNLDVGIVACRDAVDDVWILANAIDSALTDLLKATRADGPAEDLTTTTIAEPDVPMEDQ